MNKPVDPDYFLRKDREMRDAAKSRAAQDRENENKSRDLLLLDQLYMRAHTEYLDTMRRAQIADRITWGVSLICVLGVLILFYFIAGAHASP